MHDVADDGGRHTLDELGPAGDPYPLPQMLAFVGSPEPGHQARAKREVGVEPRIGEVGRVDGSSAADARSPRVSNGSACGSGAESDGGDEHPRHEQSSGHCLLHRSLLSWIGSESGPTSLNGS